MDQQEQLFTIQQLSLKLNIPKPTLRFWEKELEDVFVPLRTRGGQRRYTVEHVSTIEEIKKLKGEGMSLLDIRRAFHNNGVGKHSNSKRIDLLVNRIAEVVRAEIANFIQTEDLNPGPFETDEGEYNFLLKDPLPFNGVKKIKVLKK